MPSLSSLMSASCCGLILAKELSSESRHWPTSLYPRFQIRKRMIENAAWFSTYSAILIGLCRLIALLKLKIKLSLVLKDLVSAFINCCLPWFFCSYGSILEILKGGEENWCWWKRLKDALLIGAAEPFNKLILVI